MNEWVNESISFGRIELLQQFLKSRIAAQGIKQWIEFD
jgi:hypothetical protein